MGEGIYGIVARNKKNRWVQSFAPGTSALASVEAAGMDQYGGQMKSLVSVRFCYILQRPTNSSVWKRTETFTDVLENPKLPTKVVYRLLWVDCSRAGSPEDCSSGVFVVLTYSC